MRNARESRWAEMKDSGAAKFLSPIRVLTDAAVGLISLAAGAAAGAPWFMVAIGTGLSVAGSAILQALLPLTHNPRPSGTQWAVVAVLAATAIGAVAWRLA